MTETCHIEVERLAFRRKRVPVLTDINMSLRTGALGVLGPNGAGKSTLLALIATALNPPPGAIYINGLDVASTKGKKEARRHIGYQQQAPSFVPTFTVEETVLYAAWLKGIRRPQQAVAAALEAANVSTLAHRKVSKISGGQQKRVSIAQAIVHRPPVILLDEPTASLDPHERNLLLNVLEGIAQTSALLISTHNARDIADTCSRVLVVKEGRSVFEGEVSSFISSHTSGQLPDRIDSAYSTAMGV